MPHPNCGRADCGQTGWNEVETFKGDRHLNGKLSHGFSRPTGFDDLDPVRETQLLPLTPASGWVSPRRRGGRPVSVALAVTIGARH